MSYAISPSMSDDERDIDIESDVSFYLHNLIHFQSILPKPVILSNYMLILLGRCSIWLL